MTVTSGDIFRLVVGYEMPNEQEASNVLGLKINSGTGTDLEMAAAAAAFITSLYANLQGVIHNQVDLAECRLVEVTWAGAEWITARVLGTFSPAFTPTDANDMLPHAVAPVITLPTLDPKRKGKVKLTGFSEVQQAESDLVTGAKTAMSNFAVDLRAGFTAGTAAVEYAVLGDDGAARSSTGYIIRSIVGSQRSRKPGIGI